MSQSSRSVRLASVAVGVTAAMTLCASAFAAAPTPDPTATPTPYVSPTAPTQSGRPVSGYGPGSLTALTLPVQDSGRSSRQVWVWLPPGVTDSPLLPVVYLLHGQNESPRTPFAHGIAGVLSQAFANGTPPFELVVPDGVSAVRSDDEWADAWDSADSLESFVGQQVIAAVEGQQPRPRSLRAIAGFSMGAYGAAVMAARQSNQFGQYVGFAGYYHLDDPQGAVGPNATYRYLHTPLARADQYGRSRVLLLDCTADGSSPVFGGEVSRMRAALARQGHAPGSDVSPGTHSWDWVNTQLPFAATFLAQGWGRG
jgi:S-formylglutathione hydrolase FrmB